MFIAVGATLLSLFSFMFLLFGVALIGRQLSCTGTAMRTRDIEDNELVRSAPRHLTVTDDCVEVVC